MELLIHFLIIVVTILAFGLLVYLIFKNEIQAIRAYVNEFNCIRCGGCCFYDIAIGKREIEKIQSLGHLPKDFVSSKFSINFIKRTSTGACFFLKEDDGKKVCRIYDNRPGTCRRFPYLKYLWWKGCDLRCREIKNRLETVD